MATQMSKKRKYVAYGVFFVELNEVLTQELSEDGCFVVEVRVTPMRTETIIHATCTQNILGGDLPLFIVRCLGFLNFLSGIFRNGDLGFIVFFVKQEGEGDEDQGADVDGAQAVQVPGEGERCGHVRGEGQQPRALLCAIATSFSAALSSKGINDPIESTFTIWRMNIVGDSQ